MPHTPIQVKVPLTLQALALAAGNYVGWTTIAKEVTVYCGQFDGSLWRLTDFSGTVNGNPLMSACFWGSIVFAIALGWTIWALCARNREKLVLHASRLWWLLLGGTLFALVNNIPIFYDFYTKPAGGTIGCSAGIVSNPFFTSCFLGFSAFLAAFIFASFARWLICRTDH
jgi:hypothetical protein